MQVRDKDFSSARLPPPKDRLEEVHLLPVIQAYPNGLTMGTGNPAPTGGKRATINGWSTSAVRRHTRFLYSVDTSQLSGHGYALTLTVRDLPESAEEWAKARDAWIDRLRRLDGFIRLHWLTEWQKRGVPHMHCAVYFEESLPSKDLPTLLWTMVCENRGWTAAGGSQDSKPIDGVTGWLKYLSKHASRGVKHYQRMGKPESWEKSGRLWGKVGAWPVQEPIRAELTREQGFRFRRLVRSYVIAQARAAGDWKRLAYLRRLLKNNDRVISQVRGVSDWISQPVFLALVDQIEDLPESGSEGS